MATYSQLGEIAEERHDFDNATPHFVCTENTQKIIGIPNDQRFLRCSRIELRTSCACSIPAICTRWAARCG